VEVPALIGLVNVAFWILRSAAEMTFQPHVPTMFFFSHLTSQSMLHRKWIFPFSLRRSAFSSSMGLPHTTHSISMFPSSFSFENLV